MNRAELNVKNWKLTHSLLNSRYKHYAWRSRYVTTRYIQRQCRKMIRMRVQSAEMGNDFKETLRNLEFTEQKHDEWRRILRAWTIDQNRAANIAREKKKKPRVQLDAQSLMLIRARHMPGLKKTIKLEEMPTCNTEVKGDSDAEDIIKATIRELKFYQNEGISDDDGDEIYGIPKPGCSGLPSVASKQN